MNRIAVWTVVGILLVGGVFYAGKTGLFNASKTEGAGAESKPDAKPGSAEPARPAGDFEVASVDGVPIYHSEFQAALKQLPPNVQPVVEKPSGRRVLVEQLVKMKLLTQKAQAMGLDKSPEIEAQIAVMRDNLLVEAVLQKLVEGDKTDPKTFYETYKNQFRFAKTRTIIIACEGGVVPAKGGGKPPTEAEAKEKAAKLVERIRKGEDFAVIARAESDEPQSAAKGGDMGMVRPGSLGGQLDEVVDKLEVNAVSDPVRSAYGYQIFQVTGRDVSKYEEIEQALQAQGGALRAQIIVGSMREKAKVKYNEDFFKESAQ